MKDRGFSTMITVDRTPDEVYAAINEPRTWWTASIEGSAKQVGDEFVFDSPGHHCWKFRVTELDPPHRVVWRVLADSSTDFVEDTTEWNGTEVQFELSAGPGATQIRFTHAGLVPEFACFEACSTGWSGYIQHSLRGLLTTGRAEPGAY